MLVVTPTFTDNFNTNFGANAAAAQAAWIAAAQVFTTNFADNIHINITVDAVAGTNVFGQSSTPLLSISYPNLLAKVRSDAKTQNDQTASFNSLEARKATFLLALIWIGSPVAGLRPMRAARLRT